MLERGYACLISARQGQLRLEYAYNTTDCWFRIKTVLTGMVTVDSILAYKHFGIPGTRAGRRTGAETQQKYVDMLTEQLIRPAVDIRPGRSPLEQLASIANSTSAHRLVRLPQNTNQKEGSPNFGKKYQQRQKCAVCSRVHGKFRLTMYQCFKCSDNGKPFYLCADGSYKKDGKTEFRDCFSYHVCNKLPAKRQRRQ